MKTAVIVSVLFVVGAFCAYKSVSVPATNACDKCCPKVETKADGCTCEDCKNDCKCDLCECLCCNKK